ncbi:HNH/ENDO VII family nuclease [Paenibacillus sp. FSL R10-2796]|uniref:HNH/ENDO VII family nuclease n=1 Tax=Paenibacillus sp. FSL R10-2796 TaxID=2954663 RepID=UPI0030D8303A
MMLSGQELKNLQSQSERLNVLKEHDAVENWDELHVSELNSEDANGKLIEPPDIQFIEQTSYLSLLEQNNMLSNEIPFHEANQEHAEQEIKNLTAEEKEKIKEETGWSDEIIDAIGSMEEYEIYKKAGLQEAEVNGRKCLIREDINPDYEDEDGISNSERMKRGLSPLTESGEVIELHHIGQKADSPLAELSKSEHRGGGNDTILHDKSKETEVHGPGSIWKSEKTQHWKARVSSS